MIHCHEQWVYDNRISDARGNTTFALDALDEARHACEVRTQAEIVAALKAKGVTQKQIAEVLGVQQPNVATLFTKARNGKPRKLSYDEGQLLIESFGLFDGEDGSAPAFAPSAETLEPILDALLPLAPPGPVSDESRRALAEALAYGLELLGSGSANPATGDALKVAARGAVLRFRETVLQ